MKKILLNFEKAKDLDDRYVPPPAKKRMRFPSVAYIELVQKGVDRKSTRTDKVAALEKESESSGSDHSSEKNKKKNKKGKSKKEAESVKALKQETIPTTNS